MSIDCTLLTSARFSAQDENDNLYHGLAVLFGPKWTSLT